MSSTLQAGFEHLSQRRFDEALVCFRLCGVREWEAAVHEYRGDYELAWKALCGVENSVQVAALRARVAKHYGDLEEAARGLECFSGPETDFELVAVYDLLGRYREAWEVAVRANAAVGRRGRVLKVCRDYPVEGRVESPVFVAGGPRSGTTLLERMLSRHSGIRSVGESPKIGFFANRWSEPTLANIQAMGNVYWEGVTVDKHPMNYLHVDLIYAIFPNARVVLLERDWRDMLISIFFRGFAVGYDWAYHLDDIREVLRGKDDLYRVWSEYPVHFVSYEDLVLEPEETLGGVFEYLGMELESDCLQPHLAGNEIHSYSYEEVRKPIHTGSVGRWRNYEVFCAEMG